VFNTERASLLQVASVASFKKAISSVQGRFCANSNSEKSDPKLLSEQPSITSERSSVSNICPDDVAKLSRSPLVSRSFELFKFAYVRTSWQHVWMLFRVPEEFYFQVHPSGQRGNTAQTPISVQQVKGFPSQTQIWEDSCNRLDVRSTPSIHYP
jgi:hypothetical protein